MKLDCRKVATTAAAAVLAFGSIANAAPALPRWAFQLLDSTADSESISTVQDLSSLKFIDSEALQDTISVDALNTSAIALYEIAEESISRFGHPTRVIGSKGHWGTIEYVQRELRKLGGYYNISTQAFDAVMGEVFFFQLLVDGRQPDSLDAFDLTPPTPHQKPVSGPLFHVKNQGCDLADFPKNTTGGIALIQRGVCPFGDKSRNAGLAGAVGAVIYNNEPGSIKGTLGSPTGQEIATLGLSQADGEFYVDLLQKGKYLPTTIEVKSFVGNITTKNVIAESWMGDPDNVVMLGAHSDSVTAGPGINDDGSGTISLLEVAKGLSKFYVPNKVRFAWWAGEEEGLLGSDYYVSQLSPEEGSKIRLFMDYDMMASPNFAYQVYDANNVDNPAGSEELKQLYINYYLSHGLDYTLIPFDGRSDYDAFIKNGIPGGGIATGAEGVKTEEEAKLFGGTAGEWYDPCYHQLCDDLSNPNYTAWEVNTKLIAHSVATYAKSFDGFPKRSSVGVESVKAKYKYHGPHMVV
ncbi:unnamed protein product [Kuraishia capsulata CBS 1993]|uniref:Peptide hydrolase n=1 Tax=Kuraishia capsulata CBS 1993 TaxID=1382522 RepID=W6MKB8_9ASCO|nr:uncharacterized protein KUCA_T00001054001 [Kuraishia capsulata CBS 1993]CDK25087.1 unnamed protein product [Kuraishia capsulata CBS 1993]